MTNPQMQYANSLSRTAAVGGLTTLSGQLARIAIQLCSIVVLSRLIDPMDFGLLVMVTAIVGFGEVLRDLGLSAGAIQARSLSSAQRDGLFWLNSAIGTVLAGSTLLLAGPLAVLYGEPRIESITRVLALTFVINGVATQYRAQLTRALRFGALAVSDVLAQFAGLALAIALSVSDGGYWALVYQQIAVAVVGAAAVVYFGRWIPALPQRAANIGAIVRYGSALACTQLLGYLSRNVDSVIIGLRFGPDSLGIYNRAFQMLMMPINQINAPATTVSLPVLSRLQNDDKRFSRYLLRGQIVLMLGSGLFIAFGIAIAVPAVDILLGHQWAESARFFQILAIGGLFQVAAYASYWAFLALGLTRTNLRFALASRPLVIAFVIGGSAFDVLGVAAAYAASLSLVWLWGLYWLRNVSAVPVWSMFTMGMRTVSVLLAVALCGATAVEMVPEAYSVVRVCVGMGVFMVAIFGMSLFVRAFREDLLTVARTIHSALKGRRASKVKDA